MRAAVFSFSARGAALAQRLAGVLRDIGYEAEAMTVAKYAEATGLAPMLPDYKAACAAAFDSCEALVFVGAAGIAVRAIAPHIKSKLTDPAVVSIHNHTFRFAIIQQCRINQGACINNQVGLFQKVFTFHSN